MDLLQFPHDKKIQNYSFSLSAVIGKGAYGTVYIGRHVTTQEIVALKVVDKKNISSEYSTQLLQQEIQIVKSLNHINVVRFIDVFYTANNTYIITEYCSHGDLRQYIRSHKKIQEAKAINIIEQLLHGIKELMKNGIIHRDIKPANILIQDNIFKLTDFGFAKKVHNHQDTLMNSLVGTPLYMSPQILKRMHYTSKCDIWSIGLILYEMIYGCTPWPSRDIVDLLHNLQSIPLKFPSTPEIQDNTKNFIQKCLEIREEDRIDWSEIYSHPIFKKQQFQPYYSRTEQELERKEKPIQNVSPISSDRTLIQRRCSIKTLGNDATPKNKKEVLPTIRENKENFEQTIKPLNKLRKDKDAQIKERYNTEVPKENSNLIRHPSSKYVGIVINKKIEEVIQTEQQLQPKKSSNLINISPISINTDSTQCTQNSKMNENSGEIQENIEKLRRTRSHMESQLNFSNGKYLNCNPSQNDICSGNQTSKSRRNQSISNQANLECDFKSNYHPKSQNILQLIQVQQQIIQQIQTHNSSLDLLSVYQFLILLCQDNIIKSKLLQQFKYENHLQINQSFLNSIKSAMDNSFAQFKDILKLCNKNNIVIEQEIQKTLQENKQSSNFFQLLYNHIKNVLKDLLKVFQESIKGRYQCNSQAPNEMQYANVEIIIKLINLQKIVQIQIINPNGDIPKGQIESIIDIKEERNGQRSQSRIEAIKEVKEYKNVGELVKLISEKIILK